MLFTIKDLIDILVVSTILYGTFRLLRNTGAVNLFWGILTFIIVWMLAGFVLHLQLTGALFDRISSVGAIAIIVIFQTEIRSFFYHIGSRMGKISTLWKHNANSEESNTIHQVVIACRNMARSHTGALIVFTQKDNLNEYTDTGEKLDAIVSARTIEHIFFKNAPLHDGALCISQFRLDSAACILPLSSSTTLPKQYGLRHRAALGIAEQTDAVALVVSEETGGICIAKGNQIVEIEPDNLENKLQDMLQEDK